MSQEIQWHRRIARVITLTLTATSAVIALGAQPVLAEPACQNGGAYVIGLRGTSAGLNAAEVTALRDSVQAQLSSTPNYWAELGNLDNNDSIDEAHEYPAKGLEVWPLLTGDDQYLNSVSIGALELSNHLNRRYANGGCSQEAVAMGGYSMGAEALHYALTGLTPEAMRHVAYVAFYGDPRNIACGGMPWTKNPLPCVSGAFGPFSPYIPAGLELRAGSWCDTFDGACTGDPAHLPIPVLFHTHNGVFNAYDGTDGWVAQSAPTIAAALRTKIAELSPPPPPVVTTGPPLFFIKTRNTDPARGWIEVHTALPSMGYRDGWHAGTRFGTGEQNNGWFQMVGDDLWYIKTKNTGSGRVELHSATATSGYKSGESLATYISTNDQDNGWFQMVGTELFFIKTKNTAHGKVEVHSATRGSDYKSGQHSESWMPASDHSNGWFQMLGADLFFVKTKNTGSGQVEMHVAWASTDYKGADHSVTRFGAGEQDNGWFQIIHRDLWFIKTRNTGGTVEIHSATEASDYKAGQSNGTWLSPLDQSNGWFQVGIK